MIQTQYDAAIFNFLERIFFGSSSQRYLVYHKWAWTQTHNQIPTYLQCRSCKFISNPLLHLCTVRAPWQTTLKL